MNFQEFKLSKREETFRIGKVSPVELLAFGKSEVNKSDDEITQQKMLINFSLEHTEVKIGETWMPVKNAKADVWWPSGIEKDLMALAEIDAKFQELVLTAFFPKSSE